MSITREQATVLTERVKARLDGLRELVREKYNVDVPYIVRYNLKGRTAGFAYKKGDVIRLNGYHLINNTEHFILNTVGHEYAHLTQFKLYTRSMPHGWQWQSIMHTFGLEPKVCHDYDSVPGRRTQPKKRAYCGCPEGIMLGAIQARRIPQYAACGRYYTCKKCRQRITLTPKT